MSSIPAASGRQVRDALKKRCTAICAAGCTRNAPAYAFPTATARNAELMGVVAFADSVRTTGSAREGSVSPGGRWNVPM